MAQYKLKIEYRMTCDRVNHKALTKGMFVKACYTCEHAGYHDTTGIWWEKEERMVEAEGLNEVVKAMESIDYIPGAEGVIVSTSVLISNTEAQLRTSKSREPQIAPENKHLHKGNRKAEEFIGGEKV